MSASPEPFLLLTCEHGGNQVPPQYADLFTGHDEVLQTHRGYDIGALGVALRMAARLSAPIVFSTTTRLLIDLNRSLDQHDALSEFTRDLPQVAMQSIVDAFYTPHRDSVTGLIEAAIRSGRPVIHVGVHSCTDVLRGQHRELDIALLFDPGRPLELDFCERWRSALLASSPSLRCPFNEPYKGTDDGLTTSLRSQFPADCYLGIEIEVRQGIILNAQQQSDTGDLLAGSIPL